MAAKTFHTPLLTGRKAFGAVNKMISTPAANPQEKKLLKPQVAIDMNNYVGQDENRCTMTASGLPFYWDFLFDILLNTGDEHQAAPAD